MESSSPSNATEVRAIRKWFLVALVLSLAVHGALFVYFRTKELPHFTFTSPTTERLVPRAFTVKKVTIPEELLKPAETPAPKPANLADPSKTVLSEEKPSADTLPNDVRLTPSAPASAGDLTKTFAAEKPRVEAAKINQPGANAQVEQEIASLPDQIGPKNAPKIAAGNGGKLPESAVNGTGGPDASEIDKLLAQSGPFTGNGGPLHISDKSGAGPGGALFEYDSATLRPEAVKTLGKLGALIERIPRHSLPNATFTIEGYTDSFGPADYNQKLSQARADAVKAWLVENMKLNPAKIEAKGLGSTRLTVPATGTREEQAPNRRVEIVIRTPKN
ncbi:MAG: OmpA family protein [Chthoniobacteraceae bacterium]|nr:OmpA family protein [Chthoniobacteraceae bacterium]